MSSQQPTSYKELEQEIESLKAQVTEAHEIIEAISKGEVDGFVVKNEDKHQVYTLNSADIAYRIFIEKMAEGAATINSDNIITYCNSRFAKMINTPLENVIGFSLSDFIPPENSSYIIDLLDTVWATGEGKAEIILPGENMELPVLLSLSTLQMNDGTVISAIATDISLQKQAQKHKLVMERKDEFISIASHELKTPVTSIKGYVQLLKHNFQNEGNATAVNLLSRVDSQISKLSTLISDLLDVSKIEKGQLQYEQERFEFNQFVEEVVEECKMSFVSHTINCKYGKPGFILGDRNKLAQVITNLIGNGVKYSVKGTTIDTSIMNDGANMHFEVTDEGIGISADKQMQVFERFYRVSGKNESTYSGLGLGLYISSEIIKRHNGVISVASEEGKGSTFYFKIPLSK